MNNMRLTTHIEEKILKEISQRIIEPGLKPIPDFATRTIWLGDKMRIELEVIPTPEKDSSLIELHIGTYLEEGYFPQGIIDNIAGFGNTDEEKVLSLTKNYLSTTFQTIINSLVCYFDKGCDIYAADYHWHTCLGNLYLLGKWQTPPKERDFYDLLVDILPQNFTTNVRIQSLKCYVARIKEDYIIECLLNNESWDEGAERLRQYAQIWPQEASFLVVKQLLVFRLCDGVHN
jgi:hypothetical protein